MAKLLIELLSEEIPARMQARAAEDFRKLVVDGLRAAGLVLADARAFATPRRLTLAIDGIPASRPDTTDERRGPRVGAPDGAIQGFLKGAGLTSLEQAEKRDTGKGEFWFAVVHKKGGPTADILPEIVLAAIRGLSWPKSMRWGSGTFAWVRPLHSIIAMFDGKVLPGALELGGDMAPVVFGDRTRGHRFLSHGAIKVVDFSDYARQLRKARVILDARERKAVIHAKVATLAADAGLRLREDDGLLDEVAGLVEWPSPHMGTIDPAFMDVPAEVLITSMRAHQRYFACVKPDGALANRFVIVANTLTSDGGTEIISGNERVLRARLSDAKFFWDQDRKVKLADRLPALDGIVFHAKLGSQGERVKRIAALAKEIVARETGGFFTGVDPAAVEQAATLCKADLTSGMVGEFPELQGVMGRYYARGEGLPLPVCDAIAEHYQPVGPNDSCPNAPVSVAVALADKIDTLVGFWAIDEKPTGSRDPYALRRAALGVVRLLVENNVRVKLGAVFASAFSGLPERVRRSALDSGQSAGSDIRTSLEAAFDSIHGSSLLDFFADRLKVQARERGVRHDLVDAAFALGGEDDLVRLLSRVTALQDFVGTEDGRNLQTAYDRAANIVKAEERKEKDLTARLAGDADAALLEAAEEKAVHAALSAARAAVDPALAREDFTAAMAALAALRAPLDAFFDKVTVNVAENPPLRLNRLKLLRDIRATIDRVADFSKIEG